MLPDRWDGMSGMNFGKDYSALGTMLEVYDVPIKDRALTMYLLKQIEIRKVEADNKESKRRQEAEKRKSKAQLPKKR